MDRQFALQGPAPVVHGSRTEPVAARDSFSSLQLMTVTCVGSENKTQATSTPTLVFKENLNNRSWLVTGHTMSTANHSKKVSNYAHMCRVTVKSPIFSSFTLFFAFSLRPPISSFSFPHRALHHNNNHATWQDISVFSTLLIKVRIN